MANYLSVDVLVVGLGPAGGSAAISAARSSLKVMAIDRRQNVGLPVQCAEFVPMPMSKHVQGEGVLLQSIDAMKSILPSGEVMHSDFPGLMIDRARFDQALAIEATQHGAGIYQNSTMVELDPENHCAKVKTPDGDLMVEYKLLIAADGPHSFVAHALGLPPLETIATRQYTVPLMQPYEDTDVWLSDEYPGGYAWLFPRGKMANLGLGGDKSFLADLKIPLDALHKELQHQGVIGEEILSRTGGAIPVGGLRRKLVMENILFVGDAAGLTHPITGAGIAAAVISGQRAGQAAGDWVQGNNGNALENYEEEIRDQYEPVLLRAVERRRWLNNHWHTEFANSDVMHRRGWIAFPEYFQTMELATDES